MSILQKHLTFVKEQIEFQKKMEEKFADNPFRQTLHKNTREKYILLLNDLASADEMLDKPSENKNASPTPVLPLALSLSDIEGLPPELVNELSVSGDKTEFTIMGLVEENGGIISLDRLIVGLYKKTKEIHKRQNLTSKLYRMAGKGQIYSVPTKKGVYSNRPVSEEEAKTIFGGDDVSDLV